MHKYIDRCLEGCTPNFKMVISGRKDCDDISFVLFRVIWIIFSVCPFFNKHVSFFSKHKKAFVLQHFFSQCFHFINQNPTNSVSKCQNGYLLSPATAQLQAFSLRLTWMNRILNCVSLPNPTSTQPSKLPYEKDLLLLPCLKPQTSWHAFQGLLKCVPRVHSFNFTSYCCPSSFLDVR